jgi:hypothetical protein
VDAVARHHIHLGSKNFLHALLQRHQIVKREALRTREIEKHIDVLSVVGLVTRDRAKEEKRADTGIAKFWLVLLQQGDNLVAFHLPRPH